MTIGIYIITNSKTGDAYIGQSTNIERRWQEHKTPKNIQKNSPLYNAIRIYGIDAFEFSVLEECAEQDLHRLERMYIKQLKPSYNRNEGGKGNVGYKPTELTKSRLKEAGKRQWARMTDEQKAKVIATQLKGPEVGHQVSEATRQKLREANLGKRQSRETKAKRSEKMKGSMKGNANRKRSVICINLERMEVEIFPMLLNASRYIKTDPTHLVKVLKRENPIIKGWYVTYLCSVETNCDECSSVGLEMSTNSKCVASRGEEEIVHAHKMVNCGASDKGIIQLAIRSGQFRRINVSEVKEGEMLDLDILTGEVAFKARPNRHDLPTIGFVAYFELTNGFSKSLYMTLEEIRQHRERFSKAKNSPWDTDFNAMAQKTVLKLLLNRYAPLSVDMQKAVVADQAVFTKGIETPEYVDNPRSDKGQAEQSTPAEASDGSTYVDFFEHDAEKIKEELDALHTSEELDAYWASLGNPTDRSLLHLLQSRREAISKEQ